MDLQFFLDSFMKNSGSLILTTMTTSVGPDSSRVLIVKRRSRDNFFGSRNPGPEPFEWECSSFTCNVEYMLPMCHVGYLLSIHNSGYCDAVTERLLVSSLALMENNRFHQSVVDENGKWRWNQSKRTFVQV
jgi:hypothetical protein